MEDANNKPITVLTTVKGRDRSRLASELAVDVAMFSCPWFSTISKISRLMFTCMSIVRTTVYEATGAGVGAGE